MRLVGRKMRHVFDTDRIMVYQAQRTSRVPFRGEVAACHLLSVLNNSAGGIKVSPALLRRHHLTKET